VAATVAVVVAVVATVAAAAVVVEARTAAEAPLLTRGTNPFLSAKGPSGFSRAGFFRWREAIVLALFFACQPGPRKNLRHSALLCRFSSFLDRESS
jgi:hypothetical protein